MNSTILRSSRLLARLAGVDPTTPDRMLAFSRAVTRVAPDRSPIAANRGTSRPGSPAWILGRVREQLGRARRWRRLAAEARREGDVLTSLAYELRTMRLLGTDRFGALSEVAATLRDKAFARQALAAEASYGVESEETRFDQVSDLLQAAARNHANLIDPDWTVVDDRRSSSSPRATLIVSLYGAAKRLPRFLRETANQSLARRGELELVLVDSASPTDERSVFRQLADELRLNAVFVRTPQRESIQTAWNRGLSLARAPYVAFWGVDENGSPEALEKLANALDADENVHWAQGDSAAFELDEEGRILRQSYAYRRDPFEHGTIHVSPQSLTYVGALYRKSLHARYGWYDGGYRGAGDTEFLHRVSPTMRAVTLPETLGFYWNYPDDRVTASPLAEIEDASAYDLHHSPAGIAYAFEGRSAEELDRACDLALRFRPAAHEHFASDVELARNLAVLRRTRFADEPAAPIRADDLDRLLQTYRRLDEARSGTAALFSTAAYAMRFVRTSRRRSPQRREPACWVFNDVRYSRYSHEWPLRPAPASAGA